MKYSTERWSTNLINVKNKKQKQKQKQKTSKQTKLKKNNRKKQRKQNIEKKEEEEKTFMNSNHLTQKNTTYVDVHPGPGKELACILRGKADNRKPEKSLKISKG
jgi:hypothetical protein